MELSYYFGEYEPDDSKLDEFIAEEFAERYGIFKDIAKQIIFDYDLSDTLQEDFYDEIKEYFRGEAEAYYDEVDSFIDLYMEDY